MNKSELHGSLLLVITAMIWGFAFVAQSVGNVIGAYAFNGIRSLIGALFLFLLLPLLDRLTGAVNKPRTKEDWMTLIKSGVICGVLLSVATNLQQVGIVYVEVGKAGFLTACYILLVPILSIFLKKPAGLRVWISVLITLVGLYLLCFKEDSITLSSLSPESLIDSFKSGEAFGTLLLIGCALFFSFQIMAVDHYVPVVDGVRLSCIQFLVCGVVTCLLMAIFEHPTPQSLGSGILAAAVPLLYAGIGSCGIAYTLQIIAQKQVRPTVASLLMSLESVFSVIGGAILLKEYMDIREMIGCGIIFIAIILVQLPVKNKTSTSAASNAPTDAT